jgi:hypothetical protein
MRSTTSHWLVVGLGVLMRALGFLATGRGGLCLAGLSIGIMRVEIAMCLTQGDVDVGIAGVRVRRICTPFVSRT